MAENATDLISVQTPEGEYIYASPAAHLLLGYEPEELIGHALYDFLHPDDAARVHVAVQRGAADAGNDHDRLPHSPRRRQLHLV